MNSVNRAQKFMTLFKEHLRLHEVEHILIGQDEVAFVWKGKYMKIKMESTGVLLASERNSLGQYIIYTHDAREFTSAVNKYVRHCM